MTRRKITDRELAAILTGLRLLQEHELQVNSDLDQILTNCDTIKPITLDEIDVLCETINCGNLEVDDL